MTPDSAVLPTAPGDDPPLGLPTGAPPSSRASSPPVVRVRIVFAKDSAIRFIGHLDVTRLWERAMRRAQLPLAYTHGFTPHPRITFAAPLAIGITAGRELMEVQLTQHLPLDELRERLTAQLPAACRIVGLEAIRMEAPPLMAALRWSEFRVHCDASLPPGPAAPAAPAEPASPAAPVPALSQGSRWSRQNSRADGLIANVAVAPDDPSSAPWRAPADVLPPLPDPLPLPPLPELQNRVDSLLAAAHIPHTRVRDGKPSTHDLRPLLLDLWLTHHDNSTADPSEPSAPGHSALSTAHSALTLGMLLRADSSGAGRPEEIAAHLGLDVACIHRVRLGLDGEPPIRSA